MERARVGVIAEGHARSASTPRLFLQQHLLEPPALCWYCRVESNPVKLDGGRCKDTTACEALDRERFAKVFGDSPEIMAARERGIAAARAGAA